MQSNIDGFDTNNPVTSFKPVVETFNNSAVWGGASGTNATGAQVWETGLRQQTLTVNSAHGGAMPGTLTTNYGAILSEWVTNPYMLSGTTQYVCTGAAVAGNGFTQVGPTNVTLTLTNNAALTWQWATDYWFGATAGPDGSVSGDTNGWCALGGSVTVTAAPAVYYHLAGWTGDVPSVQINSNPLTLIMDQPRSILAVFAENQDTNYGTPYGWLAGHGFTDNMSAAELLIGSNGLPVWQSYVANLNPTSAGSRFVILAFTNRVAGGVDAAFNSSTGRIYGLQCSTNVLLNNGWSGVSGQSNIWGSGGLKELSDTNAAAPRFYRVRVQLPQ